MRNDHLYLDPDLLFRNNPGKIDMSEGRSASSGFIVQKLPRVGCDKVDEAAYLLLFLWDK
jgi:hypothetical protein